MKRTQPLLASIGLILILAAPSGPAAVLFSENFEAGLGKWTGKFGGLHDGVTVPDPLGSGRGQVLTFTERTTAGDLFTTNVLASLYPIVISFDYLGLPMEGSVPDDLGGFLGISEGLPGNVQQWLAGTHEAGFPGAVSLVDDGQWHRVTISLDGATNGVFRVMLEDWLTSGGVAGDAFFDNIEVADVPSPRLKIRVSEVELCFDTVSNAWHQVQFRSVLTTNQWVPLNASFFRGDGSEFCTNDVVPFGQAQRFYRVVFTNGVAGF